MNLRSSESRRTPNAARTSEASIPLPGSSFPRALLTPGETRDIPRTHLTDKQLQEFRDLLLRKRAELVGDVRGLTEEALNRKPDGFGEPSSMPVHMADLGSDNWEQELTLGLIENERVRLREIDAALERIENKTYGVCLATHKPISIARLRAKPWAAYCIDYARLKDEGRAPDAGHR